MAEESTMQFNVNPEKTPLLVADGYLIGSNEHMVSLSFAQALPGSNQQQVVCRVAMTPSQIKEFIRKLNDHIEKFEV